MIFDLEHWRLIGEHTDIFFVQWADDGGVLGQPIYVNGNTGLAERLIDNGVSTNTPGFRVETVSADGFFIDQLRVESGGYLLKNFIFEEARNDGFCLSTNSGDTFSGRCINNKAFKCIDFCSNGRWKMLEGCTNQAIQCGAIGIVDEYVST